jgi:hypothetical protein
MGEVHRTEGEVAMARSSGGITTRRVRWSTILWGLLAVFVVWTVVSMVLGLSTEPHSTGIVHFTQ